MDYVDFTDYLITACWALGTGLCGVLGLWIYRVFTCDPYPTPKRTPYKPKPATRPPNWSDAARALDGPPKPVQRRNAIPMIDKFIPFHESQKDMFIHIGADRFIAYLHNGNSGGRALYLITKYDSNQAVRTGGYDRVHIKFLSPCRPGHTREDVVTTLHELRRKAADSAAIEDEPWRD